MVTETQLFESPDLTPLHFCLWDWIKCDVYKRRGDTQDELFARSLDAAARIKKREDQLRRTTRDLPRKLLRVLKLTVGFSNIYCKV